MNLKLRARLARLRGKRTVSVRPRFHSVTYDRFERVCLLLGLDPDDVRSEGGNVDLKKIEIGNVYETGRELLDVTLENARSFDLLDFEVPIAEEFVAVVLANFFFECLMSFERQKRELRSTLTGAASGVFPRVDQTARRSPAFSPGSEPETIPTSAAS